jgi:divalent metal cation (Fe/Co/Zn/Cd) transporter
LYCSALSRYPTAKIFSQDHRNDIALNSFGIALSLLGQYVIWWADPLGAIIIAGLILRSWSETAMEHIQMIVGKSADPVFLSRVTYIAMTHSDEILQVDTCRAYHSGAGYFVEVDIALSPEMPLCQAHDIGESLQVKIEKLANVERAFVHLDYETTHKPEHKVE